MAKIRLSPYLAPLDTERGMHTNNGYLVQDMESFPAGGNPYQHDLYHMGMPIADYVEVMFPGNGRYLIVVHRPTGRRLLVVLPEWEEFVVEAER